MISARLELYISLEQHIFLLFPLFLSDTAKPLTLIKPSQKVMRHKSGEFPRKDKWGEGGSKKSYFLFGNSDEMGLKERSRLSVLLFFCKGLEQGDPPCLLLLLQPLTWRGGGGRLGGGRLKIMERSVSGVELLVGWLPHYAHRGCPTTSWQSWKRRRRATASPQSHQTAHLCS